MATEAVVRAVLGVVGVVWGAERVVENQSLIARLCRRMGQINIALVEQLVLVRVDL